MKTKALISLITAVCICGCITGCGNADNESKIVTQSSKISNDKTEVEKSGNEENQNNDSAAENESDSETKIADEVLNADTYTDVFQVGEKVIKLIDKHLKNVNYTLEKDMQGKDRFIFIFKKEK